MKAVIPTMLLLLSTGLLAQEVKDCQEMDSAFPGTIRLVMKDSRYIENLMYAEHIDSDFVQVTKFEENPQNTYSRSGSEYFVTINTSKKSYQGRLNFTFGEELQFFTESDVFYFYCE